MFTLKTALVAIALIVLGIACCNAAHADPAAPGFISGTFSPYLDEPHVVIPAKTGTNG